MTEPDAGESAEAVKAGEGTEGGDEIGGETDGGDGAVDELEILEGGERFESGDGERDVVGAVDEAEGEQVAEGSGGVAEGGIVEGGLSAWVFGGRDAEGLEGSQLFWVKG